MSLKRLNVMNYLNKLIILILVILVMQSKKTDYDTKIRGIGKTLLIMIMSNTLLLKNVIN